MDKANPWEDPMLSWWKSFRVACTYRGTMDDRFCDHDANKFGDCGPSHCPTLKSRELSELGLPAPMPPPLPIRLKPSYYKIKSDLILQGTLETTVYDESSGDKCIEELLFDLLPDPEAEEVELEKMVITGITRKR